MECFETCSIGVDGEDGSVAGAAAIGRGAIKAVARHNQSRRGVRAVINAGKAVKRIEEGAVSGNGKDRAEPERAAVLRRPKQGIAGEDQAGGGIGSVAAAEAIQGVEAGAGGVDGENGAGGPKPGTARGAIQGVAGKNQCRLWIGAVAFTGKAVEVGEAGAIDVHGEHGPLARAAMIG